MSVHGIILFDVDGTLNDYETSITDNVVKECIEKGFAVGINTNGGIYLPGIWTKEWATYEDSDLFNWMPKSLLEYMKSHDWDTFNNVSSGLIAGKVCADVFDQKQIEVDEIRHQVGWLKGMALVRTALNYGITDPARMILIDDTKSVIEGANMYRDGMTLELIKPFEDFKTVVDRAVSKALNT